MFDLVNSSFFEFLIISLIMGNILVLAITFDEQPDDYSGILDKANYFFTFVFLLEAVIKLLTFGVMKYFS